jgi:DtxR family transcriptional regulator, Mn-dependent transcriptional regulator
MSQTEIRIGEQPMPARGQAHGNTESIDNYLKAILTLGGRDENRVTIKSLAERLRR